MLKMDFDAHNEEVRRVWKAFDEGNPIRMPVVLGINPRVWLLDPALNMEKTLLSAILKTPLSCWTSDYARRTISGTI